MSDPQENYCCAMRRHFFIGIVGVRKDEEAPTEVCDFVVAWEPKMVIAIKHCPFCGSRLYGTETIRAQI